MSKIFLEKKDLTGYFIDCCIDTAFKALRKDKDLTLDEFMEILKNEWLRLVTNDIEYMNSYECFIDHCHCNDYFFTENGELY